MLTSNTIDGLIAVVLVLLLLSLLVQSIQQLIKRLFRIKARHLENALLALFQKAGLECARCNRDQIMKSIALDFGRSGTLTKWSTAEEISKDEVLLWLKGQPVNGDLERLRAAKEKVEGILNQEPPGAAAALFAALQSKIRPFLDGLPNSPEQFTFECAANRPLSNPDAFLDLIKELRILQPPPNKIDDLPAALTAVDNEWRALRAPANQIEINLTAWFDTTIVTFTERFDHEMKRWTLGIGFLVVICFNANFFDIAKDAFSSSIRREIILQNKPAIIALASNNCEAKKEDKLIRECLQQVISESADLAAAVGLKPLTLEQLSKLIGDLPTTTGVRMSLGWLITTLLLSVGAPFWQDALQSLFGLKNRLRKSATEDSVARLA